MSQVPIWRYLRKSPYLNYRQEKVYLLTFTIAKNNMGEYVQTISSETILKNKHFQENTGELNWTDTDGNKVAMSVLVIDTKLDFRSSTSDSKKYYFYKDGYKREITNIVNDFGGGGFYKYMVSNTGDKHVLSS